MFCEEDFPLHSLIETVDDLESITINNKTFSINVKNLFFLIIEKLKLSPGRKFGFKEHNNEDKTLFDLALNNGNHKLINFLAKKTEALIYLVDVDNGGFEEVLIKLRNKKTDVKSKLIYITIQGDIVSNSSDAITKLANEYNVLGLNLINNDMLKLPAEISKFKELEVIRLEGNRKLSLENIETITKIKSLSRINLNEIVLTQLSDSLINLQNLEELCLCGYCLDRKALRIIEKLRNKGVTVSA